MKDDSLYKIYFNCNLKTKEEVYSFISNVAYLIDNNSKKKIIYQLKERESKGNLLIANYILLPHIESNQIKQSQILFIHLENPIETWDDQTEEIKLLIVILLKDTENIQIRKRILSLMRTLADENYLNHLLNAETKSKFYEKIIKP